MNVIFPFSWECQTSSQLTNSIIFQRGRSTTNQFVTVFFEPLLRLPEAMGSENDGFKRLSSQHGHDLGAQTQE